MEIDGTIGLGFEDKGLEANNPPYYDLGFSSWFSAVYFYKNRPPYLGSSAFLGSYYY